MLGFLTSGEVRATAANLVMTVEAMKRKYGKASREELEAHVPHDVGDGRYGFNADTVAISPPELPDFRFNFFAMQDGGERPLCIVARGKYQGFMLLADGPITEWSAHAEDAPTSTPKNLVRHLVREYHVVDGDRRMRGFRP